MAFQPKYQNGLSHFSPGQNKGEILIHFVSGSCRGLQSIFRHPVSVLNSKCYIHFAEKASYQFPYLDWEVKRDDDDRSPFSLGASENLFKR